MKVGRPMITTTAKFAPAASSWSTGSEISSNSSRASFLNHSDSAFRAWIGPRQKSGSIAAAVGPPTFAPAMFSRARMPSSAGVPNRPNRNQVMARTPIHPKDANPSVVKKPSWKPVCWAIHGVIASISSRYRNITSKNITNPSTSAIDTIWGTFLASMASESA